ncbi:Hypothetical predicted protein [Octopus vulgaris]|uniref:Uncharacterized protein n=1 Tax=Octopus vulgaris TaxID=6645 RepID=A0AA36BAH3_OCTVU|nr:Hypothetical predicted protein [Octopus vulgaris]
MKAAEKIIRKAAKQNKVDFDEIWCRFVKDTVLPETDGQVNETSLQSRSSEPSPPVTAVVDHTQPQSEEESSVFVKLLTIFKSPYLRKVTIVVSIECAVNTASQNMIIFMMEVFDGNIYINMTIFYFLAIITVGLAAALAKRSAGNGFATTFMRSVCMIAPYFKLLALAIPWAPGIIIGIASLCSTVMLRVCLPETGNRVLSQTIEEVNKMEQENKKNSVKIQ